MSLVTVTEARENITTSLSDSALQAVIERIEADIVRRIGPAQNDAGSVTHTVSRLGETDCIFLPSEAAQIVSVVEDGQMLQARADWLYYAGGVLEKQHGSWFGMVEVIYKPADDRPARKSAIIDLLRVYLQRSANQSESIGSEFSFTAPANWDEEIRRILRRVAWMGV